MHIRFFVYLCLMDYLHVDDVKSLAQRAHSNKSFMDELWAILFDGTNQRASNNAAWAMMHLPKSDLTHIDAHRDRLSELALETVNITMRRLSLALLERLDWSIDDIRTDLLDFCLEHLALAEEPYGIRSVCMKLAYKMCRHYPELKEELRLSLLLIEPTDLGRGVRHTRNNILQQL